LKVVSVEPIPVSVPYSHREVSSQVQRDGVTDILVRIEADNGLVGWGESSSGADACSVEAAIRAIAPMVVDRDPWHRDSLRHDMWFHGLWQFRAGTGNFAWAGIDMALWDLCGKDAGQPLHRLLGGAVRASATYFYYLSRGDDGDIAEQCRQGLELGFGVYYLKVGLDDTDDLRMVAAARSALGAAPLLRLDVNGVWTPGHALRMLTRLADYDIDFVEQPVRDHPVEALAEVRRR
jgi:glucarate dehydratase